MRLKNKVALVTGGSRGIGFATAKVFLTEGATVILCASRKETADAAVEKLRRLLPDASVEGGCPNLGSFSEVEAFIASVVKRYGRIDILVNNAGISESTPFQEYTPEIFDQVIDLNVNAAFYCTRAVVPSMIVQGQGVILNTSSMVGVYGQASGVAYPTSKFAINGLTLSLARELAPKGIRVNAVAPGITETDMMKSVPEKVIAPLVARIPLGRLGQPEDIAHAFLFLASEDAAYITGVVLCVDGLARL